MPAPASDTTEGPIIYVFPSNGERRRLKRRALADEGWIELENKERIPICLRDISWSGACLVSVPPDLQIPQRMRFVIQYPGSPPVLFFGQQIWRDKDRMGIKFVEDVKPA